MPRELLILIVFLVVLAIAVCIASSKQTDLHERYIGQAKRVLERIRSGRKSPEEILSYLRKINPYVFEELVLLCLKDAGFRVKRNPSYSGDGGIDGRARLGKDDYFIQCKRYSSAVNPVHVTEFTTLCRRHACLGLFVHTGTTGGKSRVATDGSPVEIISGKRLVKLIRDGQFDAWECLDDIKEH